MTVDVATKNPERGAFIKNIEPSIVPINFRIDAELKNTFEQVCCELGLTPTAAFTIFATKVARERRIPFEVAIDPFYSDENMARLRKSITQMETTIGTIDEGSQNPQ